MTHHRCLTAEQAEAPTRPIRRRCLAQQPNLSAFLVEAMRGANLVAVHGRSYVLQKQEVSPAMVRAVRNLDRSAAKLREIVEVLVRSRTTKPKGARR